MGEGVSILPTFVENLDIPLFFLKILFIDRGEERERNINVWLPLVCPLLGIWSTTQALCPDWDLNQRPCGSQVGTQSTEPHQPGQILYF